MPSSKEESQYYARPDVYGLEFFHATFITHSFARHVHDYYALGVIETGLQSFWAKGTTYNTTPGGIFLINPGVPHTGEAATPAGFTYSTFYPSLDLLETIASQMAGKPKPAPFFSPLVVFDDTLKRGLIDLHRTLATSPSPLEGETQLLKTFAYLISHYADTRYPIQPPGQERAAIRRIRDYLETNYSQNPSLTELAELVSFSPYYLARVFQAEVGLPPHAYLESVRIRNAQKLLTLGHPLAYISHEVGFADQSHFTHRFKRLIGITPSQYIQQRKIIQEFGS
jgi:AraC-like DNA-binding protein